jgi:hypothetical protein
MFLLQRLWIKKHKKHLILIFTLFILWTLILCFFYLKQRNMWISKYIEAERRAEVCLPLQPKIPTQKNFI